MPCPFTDAELAEIVREAAQRLSRESGIVVFMAEVVDAEAVVSNGRGWITVGRIEDALGRCWFDVRYEPESGDIETERFLPHERRTPLTRPAKEG